MFAVASWKVSGQRTPVEWCFPTSPILLQHPNFSISSSWGSLAGKRGPNRMGKTTGFTALAQQEAFSMCTWGNQESGCHPLPKQLKHSPILGSDHFQTVYQLTLKYVDMLLGCWQQQILRLLCHWCTYTLQKHVLPFLLWHPLPLSE